MLIGLCGGISAGKQSVAGYLIEQQAFSRLCLTPSTASASLEKAISRTPKIYPDAKAKAKGQLFADVDHLLDFVTKNWEQRWVTTDIWDESALAKLQRRPFFLLVSVDAPLSLRWQRFTNRCVIPNK